MEYEGGMSWRAFRSMSWGIIHGAGFDDSNRSAHGGLREGEGGNLERRAGGSAFQEGEGIKEGLFLGALKKWFPQESETFAEVPGGGMFW